MLDQRGQLLRAAVGFAGLPRPSYDRALWTLRTWLDSWTGIGHVAVGMPGLRSPVDSVRRARLAGDVLHERHGAFADQRDCTAREPTTWHATQRAVWEALKESSNRNDTHASPSAGYVTSASSDHYVHSHTFVVTFP